MFYGITLGLISVGAWQTFGDVQGIVSQESATLATLYRYVSQYPEPARSELQSGMQEYTLFVIQKGWPAQRRGLTPREGTKSLVNRVINPLGAFEPHNLREQVLHQEAMRQLSNMIDLRRKRFESVSSGMPISLWTLVLVGAALNLSLCWLFRCRNFSLHAALMGVLSVLLGLLIFMIAAMDYPFRGEMSVGPDAFQLVYDEVMMAK
jgi:hypothetical protein